MLQTEVLFQFQSLAHRPLLPGMQRSLLQGKPRCYTPVLFSSVAALGAWGGEGEGVPVRDI